MGTTTIKYYNENAEAYFKSTVDVDMSHIYRPFLKHLKPGAKILDAGCGSGRDSYFFKKQGFHVTAFDASEEMVKLGSKLLQQKVHLMRFEEFDLEEKYDGIWACASLLHLNKEKLPNVIRNLSASLNDGGIFYMSFKYGTKEYWEENRFFNCLNERLFQKMIKQIPELKVGRFSITDDVRQAKKAKRWLNVYLVKV